MRGAAGAAEGTKLLRQGSADKFPLRTDRSEGWRLNKAYPADSTVLLAHDVNNITYGKSKAQICLRPDKHLFKSLYTKEEKSDWPRPCL